MIKKYITPTTIAFFFWGLILLAISRFYPDYTRYYLYLFIIPVIIVNLIKQRKEDKLNATKKFQASIYSMLFVAVVMIVFFFITKQDYK